MSVIEQLRHLDGKALRKQSDAYDLVLDWLSRGKQIDGAVVLDPFMGSGTTAIAALNLGKQYIGIELETEYVALANQRIGVWTSERV